MAEVKDEVEELEELLVGLETEAAVEAYSEEDDAVTLSMAAPIGDQEWMVQLSPTNRKMMSTDRVVIELASGELDDTTLVWRGGMEEWMPIGQVEELTRARSSAPPPRPLPPPAPVPASASSIAAAEAADEDGIDAGGDAPSFEIDEDIDGPTPLVPPAPAAAMSEAGKPASPPPPRSYTGRPVAVDFSAVPPKRPASLRLVLGAGGAAAAMVLVTLYSLSRGGVFETTSASAEATSVKALEPAAAAAPPTTAAPAPAAAPAAEATPPAAEAPSPAPAVASSEPATDPAEASDAPSTDPPKKLTWRERMKLRKQRAAAKAAAATEATGGTTEDAPERAKPAPRSKTRQLAAAKSSAEDTAEEAEAAPAAGPTVGFNRQAAHAALKDAAAQAANCRPAGGPTGSGKVQVRYDATGKVSSVAILTPGFENTTTGSCIQMVFRRAKIASFSGSPVTLTEGFEIK
jgi:hypothetical protein